MKMNIAQLKKVRGESLPFDFNVQASELLPKDQAEEFTCEVFIAGKLTNVGTGILVEGKMSTVTSDRCARCLEDIQTPLDVKFSEEFFSRKDLTNEKDFYTYDGDFLDIREYLAEILSIEKPVKSLCSESCKGLCPVCGKNLNNEMCDCEKIAIDPRLAELKKYIQ